METGEPLWLALRAQDRDDSPYIPRLVQREAELALDPFRAHGIRRQDEQEPIAAFERRSDFVMPLFGTDQMRRAVPNGHMVRAKAPAKLSPGEISSSQSYDTVCPAFVRIRAILRADA